VRSPLLGIDAPLHAHPAADEAKAAEALAWLALVAGQLHRRDRGLPLRRPRPRVGVFGSVVSGAQFDDYADESRRGRVDLDLVVAAECVDLK
jgi:hypothetical protein